ncbi:helix-turn-helix domain-containing protein [Flavobacterium psychroterrae]|uniref:Helix-turn-helix domain-containing protein n=1 Tax=Flavobacterium psychroterrae TaxID=2133767 RepID=A0ABS5PHR5_9FLAO|nr:helix-turn-helix transcriptional regulator [Flavobacterium psychroterrae]MBS7233380.1 helix-turn-helix domain-containing protein [Flavobacterium psychroterrae]
MKKKNEDILKLDHVAPAAVYKEQFHIVHHPAKYPVTDVPHRHNFYEILWFPKADGMHFIDDATFKMTGNDLFLISEGQMHYYQNVGEIQGYMLVIKDVFWEDAQSINNFKTSLFNHLLINVHLKLSDERAADITDLLNNILKEYKRPDYMGKAELMTSYLKILLIRISNFQQDIAMPSSHANNNDYILFQRFIDLLEQKFTSHHEVAFYANELNISTRKLADICRLYNSRNPKELIDNRILIAAKRQLQFDSTLIKEISASLNFSDQYQFSKFFKKLAGISPVEYRVQFAKIDI